MEFAERMKQARTAAGLSLIDVVVAIRAELPRPLWVSTDTIRRMETGDTPEEKANPVTLAALARVYGVGIADLSDFGYKAFEVVKDLAVRSRWFPALA